MSNPVNRRVATASISLPPDLMAWAREQAEGCAMPFSAWLALTLAVLRQTGTNAEMRRQINAMRHEITALAARLKTAGL